MSGGGKSWLKGCGIGCGVILLLTVALGIGGGLMIKRTIDSIDNTSDAIDALDVAFGDVGDFTPAADGRVPADRIEVFLAIRSDTEAERRSSARIMANLDADGPGGPLGILRKVRSGLKLLPQMKRFVDGRTEAMHEHGMGMGEYAYLYGLVYYSWLGRSPGDGPDFRITGDDDRDSGGEDIRQDRLAESLDYLNWGGRKWLSNQLAAIDSAGGFDPGWRERVAAEVAALADDGYRMPWRDGPPQRTVASLEPYRDRLEAGYDELTNALEFMVDHRH